MALVVSTLARIQPHSWGSPQLLSPAQGRALAQRVPPRGNEPRRLYVRDCHRVHSQRDEHERWRVDQRRETISFAECADRATPSSQCEGQTAQMCTCILT